MSYATDVLRRRQEAEAAWQKRYNPLEGIGQQILDIDKEMQAQKAGEEKRKQEAELFGLKKTESEALTEKYRAEATRGNEERLALAEKRKAEAAAAAAEERRKAEAAALSGGARDVYGRLLAGGQTTKGILEASQAAARAEQMRATREKHSQQLADAMARGDSAEVGRLRQQIDEETKAVLGEKKVTAGGLTEDDVKEMADAHGVSYGAMLAEIQKMEAEDAASREAMGLTTQKSESEKARQEAWRAAAEASRAHAALFGRQGYPKPEKEKTPEQAAADAEKVAYERLRNERLRRALSKEGGFTPTEGEVSKMQTARREIVGAMAAGNTLRQLMNKYPDFKSYVGPVDGLINRVKAKFGANSREAAEIQTAINRVFQSYKVATTGAAAGVLEMQDLKNIMPKETDNFDAILGKLDAADTMSQTSVGVLDLVLDRMDIRAADVLARGQMQPGEVKTAPKPLSDEEAASYEEE